MLTYPYENLNRCASRFVRQRFDTVSEAEAVRTQGVTDRAAWDCSCAIVAGLLYAAWGVSTHPMEVMVVAPVFVRQRFGPLTPIEIRHHIWISTGRGPREPRVGFE